MTDSLADDTTYLKYFLILLIKVPDEGPCCLHLLCVTVSSSEAADVIVGIMQR